MAQKNAVSVLNIVLSATSEFFAYTVGCASTTRELVFGSKTLLHPGTMGTDQFSGFDFGIPTSSANDEKRDGSACSIVVRWWPWWGTWVGTGMHMHIHTGVCR